MKESNELRAKFTQIHDDLRAGKITVEAAKALTRAEEANFNIILGELKYCKLRGETPELDFFKEK